MSTSQHLTTSAIIVAAGRGSRLNATVEKPFVSLGGEPIVVHTLRRFQNCAAIDQIVLVVAPDHQQEGRELVRGYRLTKVQAVVGGGVQRQESVYYGLQAIPKEVGYVVIHDGVRPFIEERLISQAVAVCREVGAIILAVPASETIKRVVGGWVGDTLERATLWTVQTPQVFRRDLIWAAHQAARRTGYQGTDDATLVERLNHGVRVLEGSDHNIKITTPQDLAWAEAYLRSCSMSALSTQRIGFGYDVHRLVENRALILGGVPLPFNRGLLGHSDADVLCHAIGDALLGAMADGDLGCHFPDTDQRYRGISSLTLLSEIATRLKEQRKRIVNIDSTVVTEQPKLASYIPLMRQRIAAALGVMTGSISVKATTSEGLGVTGRSQGIVAYAVALVGMVE